MSARLERAVAQAGDTAVVLVEQGSVARTGGLVRDHLPGDAVVVADANTWPAAGEAVTASLRAAGVSLAGDGAPMIVPGEPVVHADADTVALVRARLTELADAGAPAGAGAGATGGAPLAVIAVGSGCLNDVVKRACGELEWPYAVVGSAASMDGYTGFGASIAVDGVKTTLPCPAPRVAVLDSQVAVGAPRLMVASGFGDLLGKVPAGADWILADAVGVEAIDADVWDLVQGPLRASLAKPAALAAGDLAAFDGLLEGLAMSGLAMQVFGGTRPASGAEHYFSHVWEMEGLGADRVPPLSHGEKVGVGSVAVAAFYDVVLSRDLRTLDLDAAVAAYPSWADVEARVHAAFAGFPVPIVAAAAKQTKDKYVDESGLRTHLGALQERWDVLTARLRDQLLPAPELQAMLRTVGGPAAPEDIGLTRERLRATYPQARMFRSRWTVLDLAFEAGWFDEIVEELFAPGGFWH